MEIVRPLLRGEEKDDLESMRASARRFMDVFGWMDRNLSHAHLGLNTTRPQPIDSHN